MKKFLVLGVMVALVGCAEKKPLTPEEQWQGYCKSIGNAARSIMLDRQNIIPKDQAVTHANQVQDPIIKKMVMQLIDEAYQYSDAEVKQDKDIFREQFKEKAYQRCLTTPHDKMPNYKPF